MQAKKNTFKLYYSTTLFRYYTPSKKHYHSQFTFIELTYRCKPRFLPTCVIWIYMVHMFQPSTPHYLRSLWCVSNLRAQRGSQESLQLSDTSCRWQNTITESPCCAYCALRVDAFTAIQGVYVGNTGTFGIQLMRSRIHPVGRCTHEPRRLME